MVSRLLLMCLGLGILSTVMGCAHPGQWRLRDPISCTSPSRHSACSRRPLSFSGPSTVCTAFHYYGHEKSRRLPTLPLRAEDG
jgi:hypothetical protein